MYNFVQDLIYQYPLLHHLPFGVMFVICTLVYGALLIGYISVYAMAAVYLERKISAHMQDRLGPMEVGFHGLLQSIADGIKLLIKEDIIPKDADRKLFILAPYIVFAASFAVWVALPFSEQFFTCQLNIGILYVVAVSSISVVGIIMAGWASNNKWSLLGAMRSASQIISYEIPVGISILGVVLIVGSMSIGDIIKAQVGGILHWMIFQYFPLNVLAGLIFFVASLAEVNRTPFDIPEAESELVAGFHTEYSGMRFSLFFIAEYANMLMVGMMMAILFFGGWYAPHPALNFIPGPLWMIMKSMAIVLIHIWLRWTLPRLRIDQLIYMCWKVLIPFAFADLIAISIWVLIKG